MGRGWNVRVRPIRSMIPRRPASGSRLHRCVGVPHGTHQAPMAALARVPHQATRRRAHDHGDQQPSQEQEPPHALIMLVALLRREQLVTFRSAVSSALTRGARSGTLPPRGSRHRRSVIVARRSRSRSRGVTLPACHNRRRPEVTVSHSVQGWESRTKRTGAVAREAAEKVKRTAVEGPSQ